MISRVLLATGLTLLALSAVVSTGIIVGLALVGAR